MVRWILVLSGVSGTLLVGALLWRPGPPELEPPRPEPAATSPATPGDPAGGAAPARRTTPPAGPSSPSPAAPGAASEGSTSGRLLPGGLEAGAPTSGPPPEAPVPLEKLLLLEPRPAELDPLDRLLEAPDDEATEDERAERRLRLEHRRGAAEHRSQRQLEDELGVSLPLDEEDSFRLRGGVRIEREKSARDDDVDAGPAIGLEKRF